MGMWEQVATPWTKQETGSGLRDYFANNFDLSKIATDLVGRVKEHQQQLISLDAYRKTQAVARKIMYSDGVDCIRQLSKLGEFQFANQALQPFLVAMPEYRTLYNQNLAAGFENGFSKHDAFRGTAYMHTDDNYREATSGLSNQYDENHIWNWVSNEDRAKRLNNIEKVEIQINWGRAADFDWEDADPFSEYNASI
jgi:hypothetical protein